MFLQWNCRRFFHIFQAVLLRCCPFPYFENTSRNVLCPKWDAAVCRVKYYFMIFQCIIYSYRARQTRICDSNVFALIHRTDDISQLVRKIRHQYSENPAYAKPLQIQYYKDYVLQTVRLLSKWKTRSWWQPMQLPLRSLFSRIAEANETRSHIHSYDMVAIRSIQSRDPGCVRLWEPAGNL